MIDVYIANSLIDMTLCIIICNMGYTVTSLIIVTTTYNTAIITIIVTIIITIMTVEYVASISVKNITLHDIALLFAIFAQVCLQITHVQWHENTTINIIFVHDQCIGDD